MVGADRDEQTDQALGVQTRVRGEPGGRGQGGGVLGQAEDLDEAGGLDVGVDEDGPARPGQAVCQRGGDRGAPRRAVRPPDDGEPPLAGLGRLRSGVRRGARRVAPGGSSGARPG